MRKAIGILILSVTLAYIPTFAQVTVKKIKDPHIRAQQQRMVFQKWGDFLPKPKNFLGININYHYTMTWSWGAPTQNRRYRSGADIRPLGPSGQQTQRMALNTALQSTSNRYKEHSDSLANIALSELYNNSGLFSGVDPLWNLYYKKELRGLLDYSLSNSTGNLTPKEKEYLTETGVIKWFDDEMLRMQERLNGAFDTDMDRGARILAYHRIMKEYRKVLGEWNTHLTWAETLLKLRESQNKSKGQEPIELASWNTKNDSELMREIINEAKKMY